MLMKVWQKWIVILTRFLLSSSNYHKSNYYATPAIPDTIMKNPTIEIVTPVESGT